MIKLCVNPFCHGCDKFDPEVTTLYTGDVVFEQSVGCSHHLECSQIASYIKLKLEKEKENNA